MGDPGVLYIGADDSNHAGTNVKGEIVVATFSRLHEDSVVQEFPNRRDSYSTEKWL